MDCGVKLGWLIAFGAEQSSADSFAGDSLQAVTLQSNGESSEMINPDSKEVEIYRNGRDKEVLSNPNSVSGEDILPGLTVDLTEIF